MTPEVSRDLAHIKNKYASRDDADTNLISEFMRYIREHEDDINKLSDIPDKFFAILFNFYDRESDNGGQTCRPFIEGEVQ